MTKTGQPGKDPSALGGFAERLERHSALTAVCTSPRQLGLLQGLSARAAQALQLARPEHPETQPVKSRGLASLFTGADAAGKTSAVTALGCELGLDVYRVDLTHVVSKHFGETEKNLRRLFDAAAQGAPVLFFDEADALFGKRSEVRNSHDRYANLEIGYFLGRMEAYDGLVILSAARSDGLSEALLDRVETVVEFPPHRDARESP